MFSEACTLRKFFSDHYAQSKSFVAHSLKNYNQTWTGLFPLHPSDPSP